MTIKTTVIVPVLHGGEKFRACLQSIQNSSQQPDELIVVVDGLDTASYDIATQYTQHLIQNRETRGPAFARNRGAEIATGDILIFFDADVTLHTETLQGIVTYFETHPNIDALMGSYDDAPAESNFLSQYKNLAHHYVHQTSKQNASTFWGACGAIRRDVFVKIGGFDESYTHPCIEDIELGYRLSAEGYHIHLVPNIQIKHHKRWTAIKLLKSDIFDRAIPWAYLIQTQNRLINDLNIDTTSRISVVLVYLLILTLLISLFIHSVIGFVIVWGCILLWLNRHLYGFLYSHSGSLFLIRAVFWHWLYFFYSGCIFLGIMLYIRIMPPK